jgi:MoxR-like ATPase
VVKQDVQQIQDGMARQGYIAERPLVTALYLSMQLNKPLLIEGEAGVGKTEVAKVLAGIMGTELIRLQCYEGLDVHTALYEWNYRKQILRIRLEEGEKKASGQVEDTIFSRDYLLERPLLQAITRTTRPVLLIDEIDRADEGFEAFLLEVLSDFQVTIPELGTIRAKQVPYAILTSNRTRELSDALRRRCLYLWMDHPSLEKEVSIIRTRIPQIGERLAREISGFMQALRQRRLYKTPGVAESLDWSRALVALHQERLDVGVVEETLGCLLKDHHDIRSLDQAAMGELLGATVQSEVLS